MSYRHTPVEFKGLIAEYEAKCYALDVQKWTRKPSLSDFAIINGYVDRQEIMNLIKDDKYKAYVRRLVNLVECYHESKVTGDIYLKAMAGWSETTNQNVRIDTPETIAINLIKNKSN